MDADAEKKLAELIASCDPATDVPDLDTALRLITYLRETVAELEEEIEPVDGEFTVFLDQKHHMMLTWLYESKWLFGDPKDNEEYWADPPELHDAVEELVQDAIDLAWDMAQMEQAATKIKRPPVA